MKTRKPRYAKYELERMSIKELKDLCGPGKLGIGLLGMREKNDFVEAVLNSGKIILIAKPEPVEYPCIQILRSMGVGQLKRAMAGAGVFFDSKDVVEKEDMVQIFVNSGRIVFMEKESSGEQDGGGNGSGIGGGGDGRQERSGGLDPYGNAYSFGDVDVKDDTNNSSSSSEQNNMNNSDGDDNYNDTANDDGSYAKRARVDEDDSSTSMSVSFTTATATATASTTVTAMEMSDGRGGLGDRDASVGNYSDASDMTASGHGVNDDDMENDTSEHEEQQNLGQGQGQEEHPASASSPSPEEGPAVGASAEPGHENASASASTSQASVSATNETEMPSFAARSIGDLRQLAASLDVDLSGCIEKREMVDLIMNAINRRSARTGTRR